MKNLSNKRTFLRKGSVFLFGHEEVETCSFVHELFNTRNYILISFLVIVDHVACDSTVLFFHPSHPNGLVEQGFIHIVDFNSGLKPYKS